jgi:hypothetical protein
MACAVFLAGLFGLWWLLDMVFGVHLWCVLGSLWTLNAKSRRSFRRRQPLVLISYLIVANWI